MRVASACELRKSDTSASEEENPDIPRSMYEYGEETKDKEKREDERSFLLLR
jgi:hypothetical protein